MFQHYPMGTVPWTNGSKQANVDWPATVENEGVAGEALTPSQLQNLIALTFWLKQEYEWLRLVRGKQLLEHRELAPTACPSGRIPWGAIQLGVAKLEEQMSNPEALAKVATLYATAQAYALVGLPMPPDIKAQLRWLLNS